MKPTLDDRPEIRVAFVDDDGIVQTTGQYAHGYFETVPQVGDVFTKMQAGWPRDAVVVTGRVFVDPFPEPPRWWIITQKAPDSQRLTELYNLEEEVTRELAAVRREHISDRLAELLGKRKRGRSKT
jgi:hypothetical protein